MQTQAVVLAGGKGVRLRAVTQDLLPKPLVPVAGQPFLFWQLRYLVEQGVEDVLLLVSHLGHLVEEHFARHPVAGLKTLKCVYEPEPLGTGGALWNARSHLRDEFILVNGDSFLPADLKALSRTCEGRGWSAAIAALTRPELVPVPANLEICDDVISRYEKGAGQQAGFSAVDAGVYWLTRALVEDGAHGRFDLESYWPQLIAQKKLGAFPVSERFFDIGTPERLKEFEEHVNDNF